MALILALLFVALLTAIVVEFIYEMQVEASFASNGGGDLEAYLAAKSAVARSLDLLAVDAMGDMDSQANQGKTGGMFSSQGRSSGAASKNPSNSSSASRSSGNSSEEFAGGAPWVDSFLDTTPWYEGIPFEPLNNAIMRASISDEYGKLNLNALMDYTQMPPAERQPLSNALREFFANRLALAESASADTARADMIVDAILDWMDYGDDEETRPEGAENDYYMSLENPFPCKNGPFDSIEELLLVKGMTPEVYYGNAENEQLPLSECLTVHGDWRGRVNPNTAPIEVIEAVLAGWGGQGGGGQGGDPGMAQEIFDRAQEQPFQDPNELSQYVGAGMQTGPDGDVSDRTGNRQSPAGAPRTAPGSSGRGLGKKLDTAKELQNVAVGSRIRTRAQAGATEGEDEVLPDDPNRQEQTGAQQAFTVCSNVFRIYGDGKMEDIMVRIVAYVWRTPMDPTAIEMTMSGAGAMGVMSAPGTPENSDGTKTPSPKGGIEKQLVPRNPNSQRTGQAALNPGLEGGSGLSEGAGPMPELPAEQFRILDWNVIR